MSATDDRGSQPGGLNRPRQHLGQHRGHPLGRPMRISVVDPGSGNLASVLRALDRAAAMAAVPIEAAITRDAAAVARADRIILPGQGAFAACMRGLTALPGMAETLEDRAIRQGVPLLGICVGMQIMAERGLEHGVTPGLGWIAGEMAAMAPRDAAGNALPLPQMGWNTLEFPREPHALLAGISPGEHAYFVHSFALRGGRPAECLAITDYGGPVVAVVGRDNIAGTQFHVEKSQTVGLRILANFLRWAP